MNGPPLTHVKTSEHRLHPCHRLSRASVRNMPQLRLQFQDGLEMLPLKHARQTNRAPQITPPLLSCGRLHLTQRRSGRCSERLPGSIGGALTCSVVDRG